MTTITIKKHVRGDYVMVGADGKYASVDGGEYFGYDAASDQGAVTQTLEAVREELDTIFASHDLPSAWPADAEEIVVECKGY